MRKSETILQALLAALSTAAPAGAAVHRNVAVSLDVPPAGVLILRDGDAGDPEVLLSPLTFLFDHAAEIDVITEGDDRDSRFDVLVTAVSGVLQADPTLGGLCDWAEARAPVPVDLAAAGTESFKAATLVVVLSYATTSPVG